MYETFVQERIAQLRIQKGASARDMSLTLGQSESYINTIENKKSLPSLPMLFCICEYFGITPQAFFDEGNAYPDLTNRFVDVLNRLDEADTLQLLGLAEKLAGKKA